MSSNDFYGRPLNPGTENLEFDVCEVCSRRSPQWLEIEYQDNVPIVRFACNECHQEYLNRDQNTRLNIARQITDNEEITETVRPGWVDEFIKDQSDTGVISTIDEPTSLGESSVTYAEAPESFQEAEIANDEPVEDQVQIAGWAAKFMQEALFGPNPEGWLESTGAYEDDNMKLTILTLGSFANHDVPSVKLSAVQCLAGAYRRQPSGKDDILGELAKYNADADETVSAFAQQTTSQIT